MGKNNKKLSIKHILPLFEKAGYQLLSTDYWNTHAKLDYKCSKGHINRMSWCEFQRGNRCPDCAGLKKKDIKQVREHFIKYGYILLSTVYKNCDTKLDYQCPKRHKNSVSWTNFRRGQRCPDCAGLKRKTIEQIKPFFEEEGYQVSSTYYVNNRTKLDLICPENHSIRISWGNFQFGVRCSECKEWKNEKKLGTLLGQLNIGKVKHNDNLGFLGRYKVDYSIRELKLAFEYDGQHHFKPVQYGGMSKKSAQINFKLQKKRDRLKDKICQEKGYRMIRITYKEEFDLTSVNEKIGQILLT